MVKLSAHKNQRPESGVFRKTAQEQNFMIQSLLSSGACIGLEPKIVCAVFKGIVEMF